MMLTIAVWFAIVNVVVLVLAIASVRDEIQSMKREIQSLERALTRRAG